ncbi:hypothetical protein HDU96_000441 [Phlyctochytrium bullatum]|nr:hypothetical protein HDU96_000441 [Phlyctochytrium bullatum]
MDALERVRPTIFNADIDDPNAEFLDARKQAASRLQMLGCCTISGSYKSRLDFPAVFLPQRKTTSSFMRFSTVFAAAAAVLASYVASADAVCGSGKYFDKILTIILENEDAVNVYNDPYLGGTLAKEGYLLTNMFGTAHPSQPNYIAMIGGDTLGVASNSNVDLKQTNLVDLLEAKGISWKTYQENYPGNCGKSSSYDGGLYRRKHNPFISYTSISGNPARCAKIVNANQLDVDAAAGKLPSFMFYTPNMDNDGHDTGLSFASNWVKGFLKNKLGNPAYSNTLFVVTFDESDTISPNKIYGLLLGAGIVGKGLKDSATYTHYSWLRMVEDNYSLGTLGRKDSTAKPIPLSEGTCGGTGSPTPTPTATATPTPTPTPSPSTCAHNICVTGVKLDPACDACAAKIIASDPYCGDTEWDSQCVREVGSICQQTC